MKKILLLAVLLLYGCKHNNEVDVITTCPMSYEIYSIYNNTPNIEIYISDWLTTGEYPHQIDSADFEMILQAEEYITGAKQKKDE